LEAEGLKRSEDDLPGMALELGAVSGGALEKAVDHSGVSPRRVGNDQDARDWIRGFLKVFPLPEPVGRAMGDLANRAKGFGGGASLANYVGTLDGEPVGVASVFISGHVAGIYNVGTVEEHRGKGIGTAMTLAGALQARSRGCQVAVLQSSKLGLPVYARMGFREICRYAAYVWTPG
jgi:GNAT superfamily N-acetyltransferase